MSTESHQLNDGDIFNIFAVWRLNAAINGPCPWPNVPCEMELYSHLIDAGFVKCADLPEEGLVELEATKKGLIAVVTKHAPREYGAAKTDSDLKDAFQMAFERCLAQEN